MIECNSLEDIGKRIKHYRTSKGMEQNELAKKLRVKRELVSMWENGKRDIKTSNIVMLANIFEISCDELLTGTKPEHVDFRLSTGLSSQAIEKLISINSLVIENIDPYHIDEYNLIDVVNYIIGHQHFITFVKHLSEIYRMCRSNAITVASSNVINDDNYEEMQRAFYNFIDKFKVKLVSYQDFYGNAIGNCKYDLDYIMRDLLNEDQPPF